MAIAVPIILGISAVATAGIIASTLKPSSSITTEDTVSVINNSILNLQPQNSLSTTVLQIVEAEGGATITNSSQYSDIKSNLTSVVQGTQRTDANTKIQDAVSQELKSKTVALLGSIDKLFSNDSVNLTTKLKTNVANMNITDVAPVCAINLNLTQKIAAKYGGTIAGQNQSFKADFIESCMTNSDNTLDALSDITNTINQKAILEQENPLNFLGDMFSSGIKMIVLIIICIVGGYLLIFGPNKEEIKDIINNKNK